MLYHLVESNSRGEYILWVTDDVCSEGLLISRWSDSVKVAIDPRELTQDDQPYNLHWIDTASIILKSTTPITWPMLVQHHPELLI